MVTDEPDRAAPRGAGLDDRATRRGRPPATTTREIQSVAIGFFRDHGYADTNVEDIAAALGISRATFFRYFPSKSSLIWRDFEENHRVLLTVLRQELGRQPVLSALGEAVLASIVYDEQDRERIRARYELIRDAPELSYEGSATSTKWAHSIADAIRPRLAPGRNPAIPEAVGFATIGVAGAASRFWIASPPGTSFTELLRMSFHAVAVPYRAAFLDPEPPVER